MTPRPWQSIADAYWKRELGCLDDEFFTGPLLLKAHGEALADYNGIFALFRNYRAIVSFPAGHMEDLVPLLPKGSLSRQAFANGFHSAGYRVIGPAFIGYAAGMEEAAGGARELTSGDMEAVESLQSACSETEWDHGGSDLATDPCSGVFEGEELAALAGYEVWDDSIAHLCVVTHRRFRGRGHARRAVEHVAKRALNAGLLPQYRTLESNLPSMHIARALGFSPYASSVAVRLA